MKGQINEQGIHFTHYVQSNRSDVEEIIDIESSEELDSSKVFFNDDDITDSELDFSPGIAESEIQPANLKSNDFTEEHSKINDDEFVRRKNALSNLLDECMRPLLERLEEQARLLAEKDLEIKKISMQVKLLPDLEKQLTSSDEELKLKHFENHTLKKQLSLVEANQAKSNNLTKLSNSIIQKVESKAEKMQNELIATNNELMLANEEIELLRKGNSVLEEANKALEEKSIPWWQKLFS